MRHLRKNPQNKPWLLQHLNFCQPGNSDSQETVIKPGVWNNHGMTKDIMMETKKSSTGMKLSNQG